MGMAYNPSITILARYFEKYRTVAVGVAMCGVGVGSFAFPPIIKALKYTYGWRGTFLMMGALYAHGTFFGSFYAPLDNVQTWKQAKDLVEDVNGRLLEKDLRTDAVRYSSKRVNNVDHSIASSLSLHTIIIDIKATNENRAQDVSINVETKNPPIKTNRNIIIESVFLLQNVKFVCMCISLLMAYSANSMIYIHYGSFILSQGFSNMDVVLVYVTMGVTATLTRVATGILSEFTKCNACMVFSACYISIGIITTLVPITYTLTLLYGYSVIFCLLISPLDVLNFQIIVNCMPFDKVPAAFGISNLFCFPGTVVAPPLAGGFHSFMHPISPIILGHFCSKLSNNFHLIHTLWFRLMI